MEEDIDTPSLHDLLHSTALDRRIFPPDLAAPDAAAYLDHLISLPLATLNKEPTLISAEAATVESELTNLCYREYPTFLSVHRCSAAVRSAFDDFQGSLDNLLDSVPVLEDECRLFAKRTQGLSAGRNRSILVQENQDKLLDLLELPQLMETCVRNGYYQEAMELASHAKDLQSRYSGNRLVVDTAKEVDSVNQLMLAQLFTLLREPVKLSTAMKTVSYLRRMDIMDETSLGLAFLSGRLYNFRTQLLQIEKDRAEPVRYLRRYIDAFREHVYDILSQHSAMFDDFDGLVSFAGQCVTDLVQLVQSYIPRIAHDPASLSSVLIQLGYCSLSFARIGLDFAPLIAAPFADTVLSTYSHAVAAASDKLAGTLKAAANGQGIPTDALVDPEQRASVLADAGRRSSEPAVPPHGLAAFPPLALFVNDNITALNALRLLAPTSLAAYLLRALSQTLLADTVAVLAFLRDATQNVAAVNGDRLAHKRTPSSPRAQLLRRNTETQLSPAARAAKRHESRQISLIVAEVWLGVVEFLVGALEQEVLGRDVLHVEADLAARMEEVRAWIAANRVEEDEAAAAVPADETIAQATSAQVTSSDDPFTVTPNQADNRVGAAASLALALSTQAENVTLTAGLNDSVPAAATTEAVSAAETTAADTTPSGTAMSDTATAGNAVVETVVETAIEPKSPSMAVENAATSDASVENAQVEQAPTEAPLAKSPAEGVTPETERKSGATTAEGNADIKDQDVSDQGPLRIQADVSTGAETDVVEPLFRAVPDAGDAVVPDTDVQKLAPLVPPNDLAVEVDMSANIEAVKQHTSTDGPQTVASDDGIATGHADALGQTREDDAQQEGVPRASTMEDHVENNPTRPVAEATLANDGREIHHMNTSPTDAVQDGAVTMDTSPGAEGGEAAIGTPVDSPEQATVKPAPNSKSDTTPDAPTPETAESPSQTPVDRSEDDAAQDTAKKPTAGGNKKKKKKKKKS